MGLNRLFRASPLFLFSTAKNTMKGQVQGHKTIPKALPKNRSANLLTHAALFAFALQYNLRPGLKRYLETDSGWIDLCVGIKTKDNTVAQGLRFKNGKAYALQGIPDDADVVMILEQKELLSEIARSTPNEILILLLENKMTVSGNLAALQLFNYLISLVLGPVHKKMLAWEKRKEIRRRRRIPTLPDAAQNLEKRKLVHLSGQKDADPGVKFLSDPYLPEMDLGDFPRLARLRETHFRATCEICVERPLILTRWFKEHGFEKDKEGKPWNPVLRQGLALRHLLEEKRPIIADGDLLAGTSTTKTKGVFLYPDGHGTMIWGELGSSADRILNPFKCDPKDADILHKEVFPYWMNRNFREYVRTRFGYPLCQQIDERFVAYFVWKTVGISHTIPDFAAILTGGTEGIKKRIEARITNPETTRDQRITLTAMRHVLEGLEAYSQNLSRKAAQEAEKAGTPERRKELLRLAGICQNIPRHPARDLDEAVNAVWITWIALNMENTNTGLSLGRLDTLFQPYFEAGMAACKTQKQKEDYIKHAIELIGCLYLRLCDHMPLLPDIGNYLFGGASSTQAITLGGITPDGKDAVCDMTYIFLKVTEMLAIRDANINARFHPGINSMQYLKRLCEVNLVTAATPIMQNDVAVFKALARHGYPQEAIRDWGATGCVEPSICGKHFGHTGSILHNMVAAMEMTFHNGTHPLMRMDIGPKTGDPDIQENFPDFESFFSAWEKQQAFIIDQAVELNNLCGKAHQEYRPTPLLSALMDGCIENAKDVVFGGARYNSSGTSNIGLADVTDSMMVIKKLVYDEKKVTLSRVKKALETNFENDPALFAMVKNKVPLFGSGDPEASEMADRIAKTVARLWRRHKNYRGGPYTVGFWSMSQHVAYGNLSGALPSGRLAYEAFTPGLTPNPRASAAFTDNIKAVASLDPESMDNNLAFNVKLDFRPDEPRKDIIERMAAYVRTYFDLGGMQIQFNVVNTETLKDAMAHPEKYPYLLVRISGYNAYFVDLNPEIQKELIARTQFAI